MVIKILDILILILVLSKACKPSSDSKDDFWGNCEIEKELIEIQEKMITLYEEKQKFLEISEKVYQNLLELEEQKKEQKVKHFCEIILKDRPLSSTQMLELCAFWK